MVFSPLHFVKSAIAQVCLLGPFKAGTYLLKFAQDPLSNLCLEALVVLRHAT